MTKIFRRCTISVGLAPLANYNYINIAKIRIIQQTREARSARQLYTRKRYSVGLADSATRGIVAR